MSVREARISLVIKTLKASGLGAEHAIKNYELIQSMANMLIQGADKSKARNFVSVNMEGVPLPFDRVHIELMRPGGKTPTELAQDIKDDLRRLALIVIRKDFDVAVSLALKINKDRDFDIFVPEVCP